jgi:hypothetical protein
MKTIKAQNLSWHEQKRNEPDGSKIILLGDNMRLGSNSAADQVPVCWNGISTEIHYSVGHKYP